MGNAKDQRYIIKFNYTYSILKLEEKELNESKMDIDESEATVLNTQSMNQETFTNMTRMVVTFLSKIIFTFCSNENKGNDTRTLYDETIRILAQALEIWTEVCMI